VVATDRFADLARQSARDVGLTHARIVALTHPLGGIAKDELRRRADAVIEDVMNRLLGRQESSQGGSSRRTEWEDSATT